MFVQKRMLTLDDLAEFCKKNKLYSFNSKKFGQQIVVQVPAILKFEKEEPIDGKDLMYCKIRVCHTLLNRNGSYISQENMEKALPSLKYRPLLAAIHQLDDGTWDFHSHDMEIDEDGNVVYIEKQIGTFTSEMPTLVYDKEEDKTYVEATVVIPETYTKAADIIRSKGGTDVSCELAVEDMSYNADKNYLELNKFYFSGCACLGSEKDGTKVEPGMKGSKITIEDFSEKNSMFTQDYQNKLLDTLEKLNTTLSAFQNNDFEQKGVKEEMNKLETLMEEYSVTMEDIDFEVEGLNDDEFTAAFEEHFGKSNFDEGDDSGEDAGEDSSDTGDESSSESGDGEEQGSSDPSSGEENPDEPAPSGDDGDDDKDEEKTDDDESSKNKKKYSIDENGDMTLTWQISHEDIRNSLYNLMAAEGEYPWIVNTYDNSFIYQSWEDCRFYKRGYSVDGDNVALGDDIVEVFSEWLTQEEKDAIAALKADYANLKEFKESTELTEVNAKKDAVFEREEYSVLADDAAFAELKKNAEKYSVEEVEEKAKVIFADYVMQKGQFALEHKDEKKPTKKVGVNFGKPAKKNPYGNLFDN